MRRIFPKTTLSSAPGFEQGKTLAPEPSELSEQGPTDTKGHPAALLDHYNRSNWAPGSKGLAGFWPGAGVGACRRSGFCQGRELAGGPCYRRVLCLTLSHLLEWRREQWHCTSLLLLPASLQS